MHRFLCTLLLSLLVPVAGVAESMPEAAAAPLPLTEVRAGQRGYGLSVFRGLERQRFEVEVLGVWDQVEPDTSYILARLSGMGLEESGVVAGMSGSPVYIDGRLAGAVAFAWPFSIDAIAGITPIEAMRRLADSEQEEVRAETGTAVTLDRLIAADLPRDLLQQTVSRWRPDTLEGARSGVGWSVSGFGARSRGLLAQGLGPLAAAGRSQTVAETILAAGDSVAAVLVAGDLHLAATGTVTERAGDRILAFGHPFLGVGALDVPMATSEVITVLSNQANSFKITNLGRVVGAFDLDRSSGVRGFLGKEAALTPLTVEVLGDRERRFQLQLARTPVLTPSLVAISVLGALDAVTQAGGSQGLDMVSSFSLGEHGQLELDQSFDGENAAIDAALYLFAFADYLLNNHLESVDITGIDVGLQQHVRPRLATLVDAHASRTKVRPGEVVSLNIDVAEYRGGRRRITLDVGIPTGIPEGRYHLLVGDGVTIDVARLTIEQTSPVTFEQALALLGSLHSRRQLVVLGVFGGPGLAVAGEVLPQLPGSIQSLWGAAASSSAVPLGLAIASQQEKTLEIPILGAARIDLDVRRDGPLGPDEIEGAASEEPSPGDDAEAGGNSAGRPTSGRAASREDSS